MRTERTNPAAGTRATQLCWQFVLATTFVTVLPSALADGIWGGSIGATSDYMYRGMTLSGGQPSVQADGHYVWNSGWFAGASTAGVRQAPGSSSTAELSGYVGYAQSFTETWSGRMNAAHYAYPGITPRRVYDYDELSASLINSNRLFLTVALSPDRGFDTTRGTVSDRTAVAYDLNLKQPLLQGLSANLGAGYNDLHRLVGVGYLYWNYGFGYDRGAMHVDLSYIGSDTTAKSLFYDNAAANRLVLTVLWSF